MKKRIEAVEQILSEKNIDAFFVTNSLNIFYFTGFMGVSPGERESSLLIKKNEALLFLPRMYAFQGKNLPLVRSGEVELVIDEERTGLFKLFAKYLEENSRLLFEDTDLRVSEYTDIKKMVKGELVPSGGIVEKMRLIKDEDEIKHIQKAVQITDKTFAGILKHLKGVDYTKLSELDVIDLMRKIQRENGGEGFGFEPIVASGKGSSEPHYQTSNKKLKKGEVLLFDLGIKYEGYTGDLTRTVFLGKGGERERKMYEMVLEANEQSLRACRSGVSSESLWEVAVGVFKKHKVEKHFIHGLGHGVGLAIHEGPILRKGIKDILKEYMTVTIEPGLYFEGEFGIRIEDFVLISKESCSILNNQLTKKVIEI